MSAWTLGRRSGACLRCEAGFAEGEVHFSHLVVEEAAIARRDVCARCWPDVALGPDQPWWRARRQVAAKRGLAVDLGLLEQLFLMTADSTAEALLELRYLIALLLLRKRRLLLNTVRRGAGGEELVLRRPRRKEELAVRVFDFDAERREVLRVQLERLLETGELGEGEAAPGESAAEPSAAEGAGAEPEPAGAEPEPDQADVAADAAAESAVDPAQLG